MASRITIPTPASYPPTTSMTLDIEKLQCDSGSRLHLNSSARSLRRWFITAGLLSLVIIFVTLSYVCFLGDDDTIRNAVLDVVMDPESVFGLVSSGSTLEKRDASTGSNLVNKKYYLIIVFVGLVLVLVLGIMLSFWCCRESFKNPLCLPCYLCECCGGLMCLECIACGLCAEGANEAFE